MPPLTVTTVHLDGELIDPAGKVLVLRNLGAELESVLPTLHTAGIALVITLGEKQMLRTLDEGQMAAAGWVRDPARNVPEPRLSCPGCAGLGWLPAGVL